MPTYDELFPVVVWPTTPPANTYTINSSIRIALGPDPATDPIRWDDISMPYPIVPNIYQALGFPKLSIAAGYYTLQTNDGGGDYLVQVGDYKVDNDAIDPFLLGIYVRLKNLPNRAIMGSINQTSDKLVAVINNYTAAQQGGLSYPLYSFNEYDRMYIAFNNPAPIPLSSLDIELVDRFGTPITNIKETSLVFHLRPASYKWEF